MKRPSDLLEDVPHDKAQETIRDTDAFPEFTIAAPLAAWDPALRFVRTIVDESRIAVLEEGVFIRAVDPANVAVVETWLPAERFVGTYNVRQEGVIGTSYKTLMGAFSMLNSNDLGTMVGMSSDPEGKSLSVNYTLPMEFLDGGTKFTKEFSLIDPASVRQVPERIEDGLNIPWTAEVNMWALKRYASHVSDSDAGHIAVKATGNDVVLESKGDTTESAIRLSKQAADDPDTGGSLLSVDYLEDVMAGPLSRHQKRTTMRLAFGEEFPVWFAGELPGFEDPTGDDGDTAGGGVMSYTQAPRIQAEVN